MIVTDIMVAVMRELLTSTTYDCFLEYGKTIHHLKTIRCEFPIDDDMLLNEEKGTQFTLCILQIDNIHVQHYPKGRITDFTDLRPTRPTYIADIFLYTKRPHFFIPNSLDTRFNKK